MIPWLDPLILQNAFRRSHPSEEYIEQTSRKRRDLRRTKESAFNAGDPGSIPGSGRFPWRRDRLPTPVFLGFPSGSAGKKSTCNVGDLDSIPGVGRSPGEGNSTPVF